MSFSLSAPAPPMPPAPRNRRGLLLLASAAFHVAILTPVLLNTVFVPRFTEDGEFEVWLEMEPRPQDRVRPRPEPREKPQTQAVKPSPEPVVSEAERAEAIEKAIEEVAQANPQASLEQLQSLAIQLVEQRAEISETLDNAPSPTVSDLNTNALPTVSTPITRPVIEAIDGPASASQLSPIGASAIPNVQAAQADAQGTEKDDDEEGSLDAPIPRRARMDEGTEAALAAAAAGGALDDAWTYRPDAGGGGAAGGQAASAGSGGGPNGHNTATRGRIYYGGSTTPIDCTQPQMLSDVQRLSCDSAEARRMRASAERGVRVQGTGNAARDGQLGAVGAARIQNYESLRSVHGGTGNPIRDTTGSGNNDVLDEMSGTNREVRKLQEQIGASNGPRPPTRGND